MRKLNIVIIATTAVLFLVTGCSNENKNVVEAPTNQVSSMENGNMEDDITTLIPTTDTPANDNSEVTKEPQETLDENTQGEPEDSEISGEASATIAFVGDMYLSDKLYNQYNTSGLAGFLGESIIDIFQNTDVMIANHEYCSTNLGEESKDTRQIYNYKAPTDREFLWKEMGVDIVSLANNHALDYGEQSLVDTLDTLDKEGIAYIGAGRNLDDALKAEIKVVNGKKIAVLAATRVVINYSWYAGKNKPGVMTTYESTDRYTMILDEIKRLKEEEKCDAVCVYVHYGKNKTPELASYQYTLAHGYIDAGADLVVGSHVHNVQGMEIYNGKPIYYNLGNFLFENYEVDTMVLNVKVNKDNSISTKITPCVSKQYFVQEVKGENAKKIYDYLESISVNVSVDMEGNVKEK